MLILILLRWFLFLSFVPVAFYPTRAASQTVRPVMPGESGPWVVRVIVDSSAALRGTRVGGATRFAFRRTRADGPLLFGVTNNGLPETSLYRLVDRQFLAGINPPRIVASFEELVRIPLVDVFDGTIVTGDLDGDGMDDIVMTGRTLEEVRPENIFGTFTGIYYSRTVEEPELVAAENHGLPDVGRSSIAMADFNADGVNDLVLGGERLDGSRMLDVNFGTTNAGPFEPSGQSFEGMAATTIAVGDYDGDVDADFVAGGWIDDSRSAVRLYENVGEGSFVVHPDVLPDLFFPSAELGDLDGDGDDDLILTGGHMGPSLFRGDTRMYMSENGAFVELDLPLPDLLLASAGMADMEGDGDMDFFLSGVGTVTDTQTHLVYVYERDGNEYLSYPPARGLVFGGAAWIDYDGNGRKEIILTGGRYDESRTIIYEIDPPN